MERGRKRRGSVERDTKDGEENSKRKPCLERVELNSKKNILLD